MLSQTPQVYGQVFGGLITLFSVFRERFMNDALKLRRDFRRIAGKRRRLFVEYQSDHVAYGCALERLSARDHLVQHDAETEYVSPRIRPRPSRLLGRHIADSA